MEQQQINILAVVVGALAVILILSIAFGSHIKQIDQESKANYYKGYVTGIYDSMQGNNTAVCEAISKTTTEPYVDCIQKIAGTALIRVPAEIIENNTTEPI